MTSKKKKMRARRIVRTAIQSGLLSRPNACSKCGASPSSRDGRALIHAHHHKGYDNPLDVEWLCPKCHCQFDPRVRAQDNGTAKLTNDQAIEIKTSIEPTSVIAKRYGVHRVTIQRIRNGKRWSSVGPKTSVSRAADFCPKGHNYKIDGVAEYSGRRWCLTCQRERQRARYYRLKAEGVGG